ncbi:MAG TPA: tetratricopeptide repeat protein [Gemmatimonadaceae bacterium]
MRAVLLAILAAELLLADTVAAQGRVPLKRGLPAIATRQQSCTPPAPARAATPEQRRAARELAQRAQQSAILGDRNAARDQLRQATATDPTNPDLAYQLARAQDALGAGDEARAEYCRFVALAPTAAEAGEARERINALMPTPQKTAVEKVMAPFRTGVAAYEAGRFAQAATAFGSAIAAQPDWADAYYDRALANAARGQRELAIVDFQQYLRLRPEAEDRQVVISRISGLRGGPLSAGAALGLGLVVPGAGQMYTGRTFFGLATLAVAGGAVAYALKSDPVNERYLVTGDQDPFGNVLPPYFATRQVTGRPYLVAGLATAGAIAVSSAVEAFIYARHVNQREQRFSAALLPTADGLAMRLTLR